ncbi:MAG TPA: hypothetical protein VJU77_19415 [Chthoniobacterales bacterium]|nr:hypothetical protein [Chthoniobacterales bacterium]
MKRFQLVVLAAAIAAAAIWYVFYRSQHTSSVAVTSLLPKETLAFVHVPDFNRSRQDWHRTDIYQLWMEPAVQDFLSKPRSKISRPANVGQTIEEIETLEIKDAFIALVSIEYSAWKIVGGFRCKDGADADKIVASWRAKLLGDASDLKQETVEYQGRQIQTAKAGLWNLSTVRAANWIFFGNDLEHLKPLLDRADGRQKDPKTALLADDSFLTTSKHMPSSYAALGYGRVDQIFEKLAPADRLASLRQIRNFCATTTFDGGKIRDKLFVGTPKLADTGHLTRASLSLGTADTFLYAASVFNLTKEMELSPQAAGMGWLGHLQQITSALSANGIGLDEWKAAFGSELGLIGDWPANSQWPALFLTLPVKDLAKANKIVTTITSKASDGDAWSHQEKEGAHYFSRMSGGQLFSLSPTIGISNRILVAGMDTGSVEAAMKRTAAGNSGLTASKKFQDAEQTLPRPEQASGYLDPALMYARFDARLRPVLVMGAAFMPGIADNVDLSKLPDPEIIMRHLSPLAMSQRYEHDGYEAESIGPVPLYPTILGAVISWTGFYRGLELGARPSPSLLKPASPPPASATASPEDSP